MTSCYPLARLAAALPPLGTLGPHARVVALQIETRNSFDRNRILYQTVPPFSLKCNGRAKKSSRIYIEVAPTMIIKLRFTLSTDDCDDILGESVSYVKYIRNKTGESSIHNKYQKDLI